MTRNSINYFNNIIMPLIHKKHVDIIEEMSFLILGSVGLGIDDELSDMEAAIYLPDEIWKQKGFSLQVDLDKCLLETNLWKQGESIISVYPLSWVIDGQGEKISLGNDVQWESIKFDSLFGLFVIQNQLIFHDPQNRLDKLRKMTDPEMMPEIIWKEKLLSKLESFVCDGMQELNRCVDRKHYLDAYIPYGDAVKALLELGFIICHTYYPYRKHLRWAFGRLPSPISNLGTQLDSLSMVTDWQERILIMESIFKKYREYIISHSLLPEIDFHRIDLREMPLHDNEFLITKNILQNPNWRVEQNTIMKKTVELGFAPEASRWSSWWKIV